MKKVLMLVAVLLGTSVMVNARTIPTKIVQSKEVKVLKHPKHKKIKAQKKVEVPAIETSKTKK